MIARSTFARGLIRLISVLSAAMPAISFGGAFLFSGETNGVDVLTHPSGYDGTGGPVEIRVCIVPGTPMASNLEIPLENAVASWNALAATSPNLNSGANNLLQPNEVDFESTVIHELGHCIGSAHPNAASESLLIGNNTNFTKATDGANNSFDINAGIDGLVGSADDVRGDDINLLWFHKASNDPLALPDIIDSSTFSNDVADLPAGHLFAANADRSVVAALGSSDTEAVMQQGEYADEAQRTLAGDDVATRRLAMSGLDLVQGNADDYTYTLNYQGISSAGCDINFSFNDSQTAFAACAVSATFLNSNHLAVTAANGFFNTGANWHFNDTPNTSIARADLVPAGLSSGDRYGYSVDIEGNYAIVGARLDDHSGYADAGSAYIYHRDPGDDWTLVKQIFGTVDSGSSQDKFGHSVAISEGFDAVSAETDDDQGFRAGSVYIFGRYQGGVNNWGLVKSFVGSDTVARDYFGRSLSMEGDTLVVGAHNSDQQGSGSGAVYVFRKDEGGTGNWGQTHRLLASDGAAGDNFGIAVSVDRDQLIVGAYKNDTANGTNSGQVYFYSRVGNVWSQTGVHLGQAAEDQFGSTVAVDGDRAVAGARLNDSVSGNQTGAIYTFSLGGSGWTLHQSLYRTTRAPGDRFGASVAIDGQTILAGAPQLDLAGVDAGGVYRFALQAGNWAEVQTITNSSVSLRDEFGVGVAVDGRFALIGAWLDNHPQNNSGGAFLETF